ncbi:MAG: AMP-binding protein [Solirubrobacteraceae bacterium]
MSNPIADAAHVARTFAQAGVLRPSRPDRSLRALTAFLKWGPTLAAGYAGSAARYPQGRAIVDELGTLTFEDVHRRTNALAHGLAEHGIKAGDRIAIMCRNHRGFIEASVACSKLGAHSLYMNTSFAGPQVLSVIERENPAALIYDEEFAPIAQQATVTRQGFVAWRDHPAPAPAAASAAGPEASAAGAENPDSPQHPTSPAPASHPSLENLIARSPDTDLAPPAEPGRTVILTSGTTGTPRGANRASPSSLAPAAALLSRIPLQAGEPTVIAAPLFHAWGFAHLSLAMLLSDTVVLQRRFDPEGTLRTIAEQRATALVVVPVMLQRMLELPPEKLSEYDVSSLRVIAASGSALPGPLAGRVMDVFGEKLYNLYGSTEVAWATIATPEDLRAAPGTAGRPPRGTTVRLLDEHMHGVPNGSSGRIFVANEMLFEGYTGGGDKVRHAGLMSTGDTGHFDTAGRLFVEGRDDDMIVSGGENVFPAEVEDLLAGVPGVREVAVLGVPDPGFGQRLRAVVVLEPDASVSEDELRAHVKANLAGYKVPREVVFVDELPRNATGKVLRRELAHGE